MLSKNPATGELHENGLGGEAARNAPSISENEMSTVAHSRSATAGLGQTQVAGTSSRLSP